MLTRQPLWARRRERQADTGTQHHALDVHVHLRGVRLRCLILEPSKAQHAGIVDEHVEPALFAAKMPEHIHPGGGIGDVVGEGLDLLGCGGQRRRQVADADPPAIGEETLRGGKADGARATGDENGTLGHGFSPSERR